MKKRVYFNEYNMKIGNSTYFPIASGLLHCYAETFKDIRAHYQFEPYIFYRDSPEVLLSKYQSPAVAAFSVSMWNENLSLVVARLVKQKYPNCLIVCGGPSIPFEAEHYLKENDFIDVVCRGEGEKVFAQILQRYIVTDQFSDIPGISYRCKKTNTIVKNEDNIEITKNLDEFPSPYTTGKYDHLFLEYPEIEFQAIMETNRGCPFSCSFCFWGQGGLSTKFRYFSPEYVKQVITWCGDKKIKYIFNADSNFGMLNRDQEIAQIIVDVKKKFGYPQKFRTCYGKNTDAKIFKIGNLFHEHGLEKGVTLARQSNNKETLKHINRSNIKLSTFDTLQTLYSERGIPIYSEMILGLPGETKESWIQGLEDLMEVAPKNQTFIHLCQILPNTEMAAPDYRKQHAIKSVRIPLELIHCSTNSESFSIEYEEVTIGTNKMSTDEWKQCFVYAKLVQIFMGLKAGYFLMLFLNKHLGLSYRDFFSWLIDNTHKAFPNSLIAKSLAFFENRAIATTEGAGRGVKCPDFGDIYFDEEEAEFLKICANREMYYIELEKLVKQYLSDKKIAVESELIEEVISFQFLMMPAHDRAYPHESHAFKYNLGEYFQTILTQNTDLVERYNLITITDPMDYQGNKNAFMKERILFGRKSGACIHTFTELASQVNNPSDRINLANIRP